jgi:hypothetical protein
MRGLSGVLRGPLVTALFVGTLAGRLVLALPAGGVHDTLQKPAPPSPPAQGAQPAASRAAGEPVMADLGVPAYPDTQFLASYRAGRGQQFYLFGTTASFTDVIAFYKATLKQKGDLVFDEPGFYVFEIGRFREDTMAFPPGITIKDYSTGASKGYLNPKPGARPARFPTVIQVVPVPPAATGDSKR